MPSIDVYRYPPEVVEKGLELAAAIGIRPAARQLDIPVKTLHDWTKHPDHIERYAELRRVNAPKWRERAAVSMEELVDEYAGLEQDLVDKMKQDFDQLEPRDQATALRSIAVAKGVTADHVGKLRDRPTQIVEHTVNAGQLEQAMAKLLDEAATVDSEAEELPEPAQLVPSEAPDRP